MPRQRKFPSDEEHLLPESEPSTPAPLAETRSRGFSVGCSEETPDNEVYITEPDKDPELITAAPLSLLLAMMNSVKEITPFQWLLIAVSAIVPATDVISAFLFPLHGKPEDLANTTWLENNTDWDYSLAGLSALSSEITNGAQFKDFAENIPALLLANKLYFGEHKKLWPVLGLSMIIWLGATTSLTYIGYENAEPLSEAANTQSIAVALTLATAATKAVSRAFGTLKFIRTANSLQDDAATLQRDAAKQLKHIKLELKPAKGYERPETEAFKHAITITLMQQDNLSELHHAYERIKFISPLKKGKVAHLPNLNDLSYAKQFLLDNEVSGHLLDSKQPVNKKAFDDLLIALETEINKRIQNYLKRPRKEINADLLVNLYIALHDDGQEAYQTMGDHVLEKTNQFIDSVLFATMTAALPAYVTFGQKTFSAADKLTQRFSNQTANLTNMSIYEKQGIAAPGGLGNAMLYWVSGNDVRNLAWNSIDHLKENHTPRDWFMFALCYALGFSSGLSLATTAKGIAKDVNNIFGLAEDSPLSEIYEYAQMIGAVMVNTNSLLRQFLLKNPALAASYQDGKIILENPRFTYAAFKRYMSDPIANPFALTENHQQYLKTHSLWSEKRREAEAQERIQNMDPEDRVSSHPRLSSRT